MHVNGYTTQKPRGYETWFTRERPFGDRSAAFATLSSVERGSASRRVNTTAKQSIDQRIDSRIYSKTTL